MKKNDKILPDLNYDDSWKNALNFWLKAAIKFFLPNTYKLINWKKEYVFLEDELQKFSINDKKSRVDKLIQFSLIKGHKILLLLHIEIQSHSPKTIAQRMFHYGLKLMIQYPGYDLISFILYIGKEKYKNIHIYQPFQLNKNYMITGEYFVLAEHSESELKNSKSIIGYALLLTKWINKQKQSGEKRVRVLKRFLEFLNSQNIAKEELEKLYQFAEILVTLPKEEKLEYAEIKQKQINYMANIVVTPENERAVQDSISYILSKRKSIKDILLEGKYKGKREGRLEGKREGRLEGKREGRLEGKIEIAKNLKAKGMSVDFIQDTTGLSFEEINKLD